MAIPTYNEFLLPLLILLSDGKKYELMDVERVLAKNFSLSIRELRLRLPNDETIFGSRIQWAIKHLAKAMLLQENSDGSINITDSGVSFIQSNPDKIDLDQLQQIPEYKNSGKRERVIETKRSLIIGAVVVFVIILNIGCFVLLQGIHEWIFQKPHETGLKRNYAITENTESITTKKIKPEKTSLSRSWQTVDGLYLCIEPCSLLTKYNPQKTIFFDKAPEAIRSHDGKPSSTSTFLTQEKITTALGNAKLSEKAMEGKDELFDGEEEDVWLWKYLLITLGCTAIGCIIATLIPKKNDILSILKRTLVLVPLVPHLFGLFFLFLGCVAYVLISVLCEEPKVNIYVDNATRSVYTIILNGEDVPLPSKSHICLRVRRGEHDLRIKKIGSSKEIHFTVSSEFDENETYLINLERANSYEARHQSYSKY